MYFVPKRAKKLLSLVQEPQQFNVCQTLQEMFQNCMFFKELQPGYLQDWILNIPPFYNPYFQHFLLSWDFTGVWWSFKHTSKNYPKLRSGIGFIHGGGIWVIVVTKMEPFYFYIFVLVLLSAGKISEFKKKTIQEWFQFKSGFNLHSFRMENE